MKLTELEPRFIKLIQRDDGVQSHRSDASIADNDGIRFLCPVCFTKNGGPVGTHSVICWKPGVPDEIKPGPGRWAQTGSSFADLSLTPSVHITAGCQWHGFITNGEVT